MDEINSLESDPFFLKIFLEDFSLPLDEHEIKISEEWLRSDEEGITYTTIETLNILRIRLYQSRLSLNSSETDPEVLLKNAYESLEREMDLERSEQEEEDDQVKYRILEKNKNSVDKFSHKEVYEIYDEFKSQDIARAKKNFISTCKELYVLRSKSDVLRSKSVVSKENIKINFESLFDQLNSANLKEHFAMLPKTTWTLKENDDAEEKSSENNNYIVYKIEGHDPNSIIESEESSEYRYLCFDCYFHRRKNLKDQPKNLTELLKKINPYCDPDEAKIEKVLEEYKKYKELDSGEEDLQKKQECKTALKQAINDALKTNMLIRPTIDLAISISAKYDLEKKINLALNSQSDKPPNPESAGIKINLKKDKIIELKSISDEAFKTILFHIEPVDKNKQVKTPNKKLESLDAFNKFLVENGGTNLSEKEVQEAFEAYETYYKEAFSQQNYELLQRLQKGTTTKVLDHEFNGIVSFLDRMPEAELNASLVLHQPSMKTRASGDSMDEHEPDAQTIPVVDINRDKVAEFKKFLEDNNLHCNLDNMQKVFALHELYEAYKPHLEKSGGEIQGEISITPENLRAFGNKIGELIFKKELSGSLGWGEVPKSSIEEPRVKLDQNKLKEILTFLNENQESEKIDNSWETSNPPLDLHDDSKTIIKNVVALEDLKKNAITEKLQSWYSGEGGAEIQEVFKNYENYANATSIQDKEAHKAIILSKLTKGDQDVSKNLKALEFLKILDKLNKYHTDSIASYQEKAEGKAKQEKPNEIIKFFFEDLPSNILRVFDCFRTDGSSRENKSPSNTGQ